MAQTEQKNNPLTAIEAKILNSLTNVETHSKYKNLAQTELENLLKKVEDKKIEIANFDEVIELNLRLAEDMKQQKIKIADFAELAKKLGLKNAKIGWDLAFDQPPTDPDPETQPETKANLIDRWVAETEEKTEQPEPQPEPIAAEAETEQIGAPLPGSLPGATASEQIANIPPVKKPEAPEEPTSEPSPTEADKTPWREDGCILLPMDGSNVKLTQKIDGYTVSFKEAKDFKVSGKQHTSVTLKILGEGTGSNGTEVNCSFKEKEEFFVIAVKLADGTQSNDKTSTKRAEMPKWLKPLRRCAIQWMVSNFPYTAAKWEDEVNYVTPAPQTTDKQPSNAAAEPVK